MSVLGGHGLQHEGAPHDAAGRRKGGVTTTGQAKCLCGWLSEVLPSTSARKRAHRRHKDQVRSIDDEFCYRWQAGEPWHLKAPYTRMYRCGGQAPPLNSGRIARRHPTCWPCIADWLEVAS